MESVFQAAARAFSSEEHLRNVLEGEWVNLYDETGRALAGIRGRVGAMGMTLEGVDFGADYIGMQPGAAFPLHTHAGDHLLYVVSGSGIVHVDGTDYDVRRGDSIFIPADYPHGVGTISDSTEEFCFLAVGHPHRHLESTDRMKLA